MDYGEALAGIRALLAGAPRDAAAAQVVEFLHRQFPQYAWVGIYWADGSDLVLGPWTGPEATEHTRIPIGRGICGAAARAGRTEIVHDVRRDPRYLACFPSTRSEIVVPILAGGEVVGEIDIDGRELGAFGRADQEFLEAVAALLAPLRPGTPGAPMPPARRTDMKEGDVATLIDLSSDTATRPTPEMRAFMAQAAVGDEQKQEDPTVNALQERVAALLGKEAALYLPSATMANEIAIKVHTQPGDEMIADRTAHIINAEAGGPAALSGVMIYALDGRRGVFTAEQVDNAIRREGPHYPRARLVSVEQTANLGGGTVWPITQLRAIVDAARRHNLHTHMDGARIMNAVVASGIPAHEHARGYESVTFCLTKGLGCPVGALVAGDRAFIAAARRLKHRFGGAMRQAGIIAAAGLYALDHHVNRLAQDHTNAQILARGLAEVPGIRIDVAHVETNLVFFDVAGTGLSAQEAVERLLARGVRMGAVNRTQVRAVTHLDVSQADVERAVAIAQELLGKTHAAKPRT